MFKHSIKSIFATLSLGFFAATGFAACAAPVESGDGAGLQQEEVPKEPALFKCCYGEWRCPTNGYTYPYANNTSICGDPLSGAAKNQCNVECPATCVDSGILACAYL